MFFKEPQPSCEHAWPTASDMESLRNKPRSEWVKPTPITVQDIEFYFGKVPTWYIETKFLKHPGNISLNVLAIENF